MSLVLSNKGKGMQSSSEQPLVGEEHCVTTLITAAKETRIPPEAAKQRAQFFPIFLQYNERRAKDSDI